MKKFVSALLLAVVLITMTVHVFASDIEKYSVKLTSEKGVNLYLRKSNYEYLVGQNVEFGYTLIYGYELDEIKAYASKTGEELTLTPYPNSEHIFSFTMPDSDVEIKATVIVPEPGNITVKSNVDGAVMSTNVDKALPGDKVYVYAEVMAGYLPTYAEYTVRGDKRSCTHYNSGLSRYTHYFIMPSGDTEVTVKYEKISKRYTLKVGSDSKGLIALEEDYYLPGSLVTVKVLPQDGITVTGVYINFPISGIDDYTDAKDMGDGTYTFHMPRLNGVVYADYITADDGLRKITCMYDKEYGTVEKSAAKAKKGETVYFYIEPKIGYKVGDIQFNNEETLEEIDYEYDKVLDRYSIVMPDARVICDVDFSISRTTGKHSAELVFDEDLGSVELSSDDNKKGEKVYIYPDPEKGASLDGIKVQPRKSDEKVRVFEDDGEYYFTMPDDDVTVYVEFEEEYDGAVKHYKEKAKKDEEETRSAADESEDKTAADDTEPVTVPDVSAEPQFHICSSKAYTDVNTEAWYHEAVDFVIAAGIMSGYNENTFAPHDTTTRAMIATVLWRMEGSPAPAKKNPFTDVATGEWYTAAVVWAEENGIVNGIGDSLFDPTGEITREQLAAMIYRYAINKGGMLFADTLVLDYPDAYNTSDWAELAMAWCDAVGLIYIRDGMLMPKYPAERAEIAYAMAGLGDGK